MAVCFFQVRVSNFQRTHQSFKEDWGTRGTKDKSWSQIIKKKNNKPIISEGFVFPLRYCLLWHLLVKLRAFHFSTDAHRQTLRAGFPGWDPQPSNTLQLTGSYPGTTATPWMCGMVWPEVMFIPLKTEKAPMTKPWLFWGLKYECDCIRWQSGLRQ